MFEIPMDFLPAGKPLTPSPVRPDFFVGELVDGVAAVDSRARIAVPVPDSSRSGSLFDALDVQSILSEPVKILYQSSFRKE